MPIDLNHIIDHTAFDIYTLLLMTLTGFVRSHKKP